MGELKMEQISAVADEAQQRLDSLNDAVAGGLKLLNDATDTITQATDIKISNLVADGKKAVANFINNATARVADMRGPKGSQGNPGVSTVVGAGKPTGPDVLMPLIGRGAVKGDTYIDAQDDARRAYRWTGEKWEAGPAFVSLTVRDVKISSVDASTKVTASMVTTGAGGSGSGGEKLRSRSAPVNGSVQLADSSNWRNTTQDPTAGQLFLEYTAADGSLQGKKGYAALSFVCEPSSTSFTEYALIGEISGLYTVQLAVQRSTAFVPGGITGTLPPGTACTQVFASLVPTPGSGASTTTRFLLSGVVLWAFSAQGTSLPANQPPETPLWTWQ
jgi:hypothetical protein